jgi:amino acid adenylation domain-containing protein/non-ribosomal peptide synthase protein (TIGR01720 family)
MSLHTFPLHPAQQDVYIDQLINTEAPYYNLGGYIRLTGSLDKEKFIIAVNSSLEVFDALKMRFDLNDPVPVIYIDDTYQKFELPELNFEEGEGKRAEIEQWIKERLAIPFEVKKENVLIEQYLISVTDEEHYYYFKMHHLITDGYGVSGFNQYVAKRYKALITGEDVVFKHPSYIEEAARASAYYNSDAYAAEGEYWKKKLEKRPSHVLSSRYPGEEKWSTKCDTFIIDFTAQQRSKLEALQVKTKASFQQLTLAALMIYFSSIQDQSEFVFGIPLHRRRTKQLRVIPGMFTGVIPFMGSCTPGTKVADLLKSIGISQREDYRNQNYLIGDLSRHFKINAVEDALIEIVVNYAAMDFQLDFGDGLSGTANNIPSGHLPFPMEMFWYDYGQQQPLQLRIDFQIQYFDKKEVELLAERILFMLDQFDYMLDSDVSEINTLPGKERELLKSLSHSPASSFAPDPKMLTELLDAQAAIRPEAIAIVMEGNSLTYKQLEERSNQLSHYLHGLDIKKDTIIPLCIGRSIEMLIAIIGIMKAGAAYVPIDISYPAERINYILEDTAAELMICSEETKKQITSQIQVITIEEGSSIFAGQPADHPAAIPEGKDLCYVIYTSGSTGKPKGVMVEHAGMINHLFAKIDDLQMDAETVLAFTASYTFDISVWQMFAAILCGGRTVIYTDELIYKPSDLIGAVAQDQITILELVPSYLAAVLQEEMDIPLEKLRYLMVTGEAVSQHVLSLWFSHRYYAGIPVVNAYGPTEASDDITHHIMQDTPRNINVPLGKPVRNLRIYIFDEAMELSPMGIPGEICVAGIGVSRGYLGRPELTNEKFIKDPFSTDPAQRMYRTGDLGRWLPDGAIEYLGRIDDQVKIRGYRIELGEIEHALQQSGFVSQSVVVAKEDVTGNKRLLGYIVPAAGYDKDAVIDYLKEKLPAYMVPALVELEQLPLSPNGKIDKKALPDATADAVISTKYVAPRDQTEEFLAAQWVQLLQVSPIGVYDNFFELGGHSLLGMRLIAAITKELQVVITMKKLFLYPTIAALAAYIAQQEKGTQLTITPQPRTNEIPLSFSQEGLWFIDQLEGSVHYHIPLVLRLKGKLNTEALQLALKDIVGRHEILRTVIGQKDGIGYQQIQSAAYWKTEEINAHDDLKGAIAAFISRPFDLSADYMLRAAIIKAKKGEVILAITIHHIAADGWSTPIIISELSALYNHYAGLQQTFLAELPLQYADYACWQRNYMTGRVLQAEQDYWKKQLSGIEPLNLVTDYTRPAVQSKSGALLEVEIEDVILQQLSHFNREHNVTLFMTLMSVCQALLYRYTNQEDICVGTPVAGRTQQEVEGMIGFFVNTLAIRSNVNGSLSFSGLLQMVKETLLEGYEHEDLPFDEVVKVAGEKWDISRSPVFQVMFVLQDAMDLSSIKLDGISATTEDIDHTIAKFDLSFIVTEREDGLKLSIEYCTDLFHQDTIERMTGHYKQILKAVITQPEHQLSSINFLTAGEEQKILQDFAVAPVNYPAAEEMTLVSLFREQVLKNPDAVALVAEDKMLTYGELDQMSDQLAHYLSAQGIDAELLIPVCLDRGNELVISILGILKAGAAYVPVDANYPQERIAYMLSDCNSSLVVTSKKYAHLCAANPEIELIFIDEPETLIAELTEVAADADVLPGQLAYVIYTSGSTGRPKGVMVEHHSVVNLVKWHIGAYKVSAESRSTAMASIGFDAFGWEIWPYLCAGSTIFMLDDDTRLSPQEVAKRYVAAGITHSFIATGLVKDIISALSSAANSLQYLLTGGDRLPQVEVSDLSYVLVNNYGPTENTVVTSSYPLSAAKNDTLPAIGRPVSNTRAYILDANFSPVPIGTAGELCVSGAQLARGYLNLPELTAEKFVAHPFIPGERLYRTGDLARWLADGNIEYLGRTDEQVKIRGYRIELGEIATVIQQSSLVRESLVVAKVNGDGNKQLVGFIIPEANYEREQLVAYLKQALPEYMVPLLVELEAFPLTTSGKVDRRALPDPAGELLRKNIYTAPINQTEQVLVTIWEELLAVEKVGTSDDFFEMGGHSLLVIRLIAAIRKQLQAELAVKDVFIHRTITALSVYIQQNEHKILLPALTAQVRPERIPLSFSQERLWFIDRFEGSTHYHISTLLTIKGTVNREALQYAFQTIVNRHEVLRTVIREEEGVAYQYILEADAWELTDIKTAEGVRILAGQPFNLAADYALRAGLLVVSEQEQLLLITLHHIAADGWSVAILAQELSVLYGAYLKNQAHQLLPLSIQYADYALWQKAYVTGDVLKQQKQYWVDKLSGLSPLNLPTDYPRPAVQRTNGALLTFALDSELTGQLNRLNQQQEVTLFMTLLTVFKILLYRYSGQTDICVGTPLAGRKQQEEEALIGFFVNTLAVRTDLSENPVFTNLLQQVKQTLLEGYDYQDMPFEKIVEAVTTNRDLSRHPLFQAMFVLQNTMEDISFELDDLALTTTDLEETTAKFDLVFTVVSKGEELFLGIEYCTDLFNAETIEKMAGNYGELLKSIVSTPEQRMGMLNMLTARDENELRKLSNGPLVDYDQELTFVHEFEAQVKNTPDAVALRFEEQVLTFAELNERANQLAHYLKAQGVKPDSMVPICMHRGLEMIVAVVGIWKAGGAYVPVDPKYPQDRISYLLADCEATVVITDAVSQSVIPLASQVTIVALGGELEIWNTQPVHSPEIITVPGNLAYVLYTSGSTGKPKGVLVEHAGLLNHLLAMVDEFTMNENTILAFTAPYTFDISVWQMVNTLICGGCTVIYPESLILRPDALIRKVEQQQVTLLQLVPSYLTAVLQEDTEVTLSALQYLLVTGEAVTRQLLALWFAHPHFKAIQVVNAYGPTEASDDVSFYFMNETPDAVNIPVGVPIQNLRLYVLDNEGQLVPAGVPGEICVAGIGVARGYLKRPELTAEKFVCDPFYPQDRMYKTGDLGRWLPDGNMEYLGRMDDQVKIRGFRIELGEIESVLQDHPLVSRAVVVAKADDKGIKRLIGYVVPEGEADKDELADYLKERLPEFMVPVIFMMEKFPLTANGKIDKKALPDVASATLQEYVAPRDQAEQHLAEIWQRLLEIPQAGIYDNFFERGGHSLLVIRLIAAIRKEMLVELLVKDVFIHPTIHALAACIKQLGTSVLAPAITVQIRPDIIPLSYSQERLWFIDQLEGSTHYHIPAVFRLNGILNKEALSIALQQVINRHEALRTVIREKQGVPYQYVLSPDSWQLEEISIHHELQQEISAFIDRPFVLSADHMLRAGLITVGEREHILVVALHHIASDGWSSGLIIRELSALYTAYITATDAALKMPEVQYADYAIWQRQYLKGAVLESLQSYWKQKLSGLEPLALPTDFIRPVVQSTKGAMQTFNIDPELSKALNQLSQQQGTTLFMTLMSVLQVLLYRYTGQEDICVGTPVAGRSRQEVEELVGFFINTIVIRTSLNEELSFADLLQQVKTTLLEAYEHQELPFEKVVDTVVKSRDMSISPLFQVMFVLQNVPDHAGWGMPGLMLAEDEVELTTAKFDLIFNMEEGEDGLTLSIEYCTDLFRPATISRMAGHFEQLLQAVTTSPAQQIGVLPLLTSPEKHTLLQTFTGAQVDYPKAKTIVSLFEEQVERTPDAVAVVYENEQLTYRQLHERSNQLGHYLHSIGVVKETLVPLCMGNGLDMIVAIIGVLKAGGVYVPMDPAYPQDRIQYMVEDTAAAIVISNSVDSHVLKTIDAVRVVVEMDTDFEMISKYSTEPVPVAVNAENLAYVIYTSGSTGRPKGVLIEHRNVVRLFETATPLFDFNEQDVWTMFHSFCFDFSVWEMYGALFYGGRLVMVPKHITRDISLFAELLVKEKVSVLNQTPSSFYVLQDYLTTYTDKIAVRYVVFGGEALNPGKLKPWKEAYPDCLLINMYGITETTVHVTYQELNDGHLNSSASIIGKTIPTLSAYILDPKQNPVPIGVPGELYISGAGVARGYLNRAELSAERFIANPFEAGERLYRTGDLARWYPDGNIEYLGRIDDQVKIRGFRIELGEIESCLQESGLVSNSVVLARTGHSGDKQLVGYVVPEIGFSKEAVQNWLGTRLPEYMVPAIWVMMEDIPLTSNGKVNRKALPEPEVDKLLSTAYEAARNETEEKLVTIWQELLGAERIGIHDNFFELGGDSISIIRVVSKIKQLFNKEVKVFEVYKAATIAQLGEVVDSKSAIAQSSTQLYYQIAAEIAELKDSISTQFENIAEIEDIYPMSDIERGMIYVSSLNPKEALYHDQFVCPVPASFDAALFKKAYELIAAKHSILRTAFQLDVAGNDLQLVYKSIEVTVPAFDVRDLTDAAVKTAVEQYLEEERATPFIPEKAPLWKAAVFNQKDQNILVFQFHHAILDGWSVASLNTELFNLCSQLIREPEQITLPLLKCTYKDFIIESLVARNSDGNAQFWKNELEDYKRLDIFSAENDFQVLDYQYDAALVAQLKGRTKRDNISLKGLAMGAYLYALNLLTPEDELTVGLVTNNRPLLEDAEQLLGCFLNTNPFRFKIEDTELTWSSYFNAVENKLLSLKERDRTSLFEITKATGQQSSHDNPFFDALFNYINFHVYNKLDQEITGNDTEASAADALDIAGYELTNTYLDCTVNTTGDTFSIQYILRKKLKSGKKLSELLDYFNNVIQAYLNDYSGLIKDSIILPAGESAQLLKVFTGVPAGYPEKETMISLFEVQAIKTPDAIAVSYETGQLSYRQLQERSNQLGHYLCEIGLTKEMLVPVCMSNGLDMIVALLGVLKAGGAYVPMDPAYPQDRIQYMVEDTAAVIVISNSTDSEALKSISSIRTLVEMDTDLERISKYSTLPVNVKVSPANLAYVIYTSGSTGRPKGVLIEHVNVVRLFETESPLYDFNDQDVWTMFHSFCFDFSVWEMYGALFYGGRLVIVPKHIARDTSLFAELLVHEKVTVLNQTPSSFYVLQDYLTTYTAEISVRYVIFGGEALNPGKLKPWKEAYQDCRLINMYGITETTVHVTYQELDAAHLNSSASIIGKTIPTLSAYILDRNQNPVPVGVPGELYISGAGVARGYLNRAELTAERFIVNPFVAGERLYRTGDLARWYPDGNLEYLGRIDDQVKIRGFRIELGEIESSLQQSGLVSNSVVLARTGHSGDKQLVAYVVPEKEFDKDAVQNWLGARLPEYMVPAIWVLMEEIPLTSNGKVNRKELPDPQDGALSANEYLAPRTATEVKIAAIWQQLLAVPRIGIYDNFFELGGHSLLAIRLLGAMRRDLKVEMQVKDLFAHATIAALAVYAEQASGRILLPAITVQPKPEFIPLSFGQERLWFIDQLEGSKHYHIPAVLKMKGQVNKAALQAAIQQVINRHEILRTVVLQAQDGGMVYQQVLPADLWQLEEITGAENAQLAVVDFIDRPFNLAADHMLRAGLISLAQDEFILAIVMHHIASDGWSVSLLVTEITLLYNAYATGQVPSLPVLPIQYADYAIWEREYLTGAVLVQQQAYWGKQLGGLEPLELPADYPRPAIQSTNGAVLRFEIEQDLASSLQQFSGQQETTLFMTLFAAFQVLLHRYSGQENICVGTPVAGRRQQEVEGLVGFFVNTLAIHTDLAGNPSFENLLQRVKMTLLDGYEHQDMPFEKIVEAMVKTRDLSRSPLFQVLFVMQDNPDEGAGFNGVTISPIDNEHVVAQFDLTFTIVEEAGAFLLNIEYCTDLFAEETIARMGSHYKQLLKSVVNEPSEAIAGLVMLTAEEGAQLQQIGQGPIVPYPKNETFVSLFEKQVAIAPDAIALVCDKCVLTYRELNAQANQLAAHLLSLGVKPDAMIPICITRSLDMIISILGVMKAGAAYIPVDTNYPAQRISYLLEDAQAKLVISNSTVCNVLPASSAVILLMDGDREVLSKYPVDNPVLAANPDNLSYVIYTSGSTGMPKGVLVEHDGMLNHLFAKINDLQLNAESILAYTASYTFDISVWQMFAALLCGGRTVIYDDVLILQPVSFIEQVATDEITILELVPSYLSALLLEEVDVKLERLQYLLVTGEAVNQPLLEQWFSHPNYGRIPVVNAYGPTEASDDITHFVMHKTPVGNSVPLGKPVQNLQLSILDKTGQLCALGIPGEICVSGVGVSRGYLNRAELTAEKFVTNLQGERMYKTGDLGRWLPDGNVEYLGRIDDQVKIRGYRIELGEIEKVLLQHALINSAVVVAKADNLVGYITGTAIDKEVIRQYLLQKLPEYMVPVLVELALLPLTANGKVDRKLLPDPSGELLINNLYVAPRNETEEVLAGFWEELLAIEGAGVNDNFFERGGHSLLAIRLLAMIRTRLKTELVVKDIFLHPTIAGQAEFLQQKQQQTTHLLPPVTAQERPVHIPLSFSQERLWFIDKLEGSVHYHMPAVLRLQGKLNMDSLQYALQHIINRHEVLRSVIHWSEEDNVAYQQILSADSWQLSVIVPVVSPEDLKTAINSFIQLPFDLSADHPLRAGVISLSATEHLLIIVTHHIASDGWSEAIIVQEFTALYNAHVEQRAAELPPLPVQYADYAMWQRNYLQGTVLTRQLEYWKKQLAGTTVLDLPVDYLRPAVQSTNGAMADFTLDAELNKQLQQFSQQHGSTLFMTLLAAFKVLMYRYSGQDDICVGIPVAGRQQQEVEGLVGFFINTLAIRTDLSGEPVFTKLLQQVKENLLQGYAFQDTPFEKIVDAVVQDRDMSRTPVFQVMFVLQNTPEPSELKLGELLLTEERAEHNSSKFDLTFVLKESEDGLALSIEYCTDLFSGETIARMKGHYAQLLKAIVASPSAQISLLPILTIEEEGQLLHEFNLPVNRLARNRTILDVFADKVKAAPEAIAVWYKETKLTYLELDKLSNHLGNHLRVKGVKEDTLVPIYLDRGLEMIIGIMGVLKAGGAYVPVDTQYPEERIRFMLEDIASEYCLTNAAFEASLMAIVKQPIELITLDYATISKLHKSNAKVKTSLWPHNLAYMIYTSGSTGAPKGVLVEHGGVVNLAATQVVTLGLKPAMRTLQFASFGFDASCYELFGTLLSGGCLVIPEKEDILSAQHFSEFMNAREVEVVTLPPSYLNVIKDNIPDFIKVIVSAGEALNSDAARMMQENGIRMINAYGPTENTVCATLSDDPIKENGRVVIGKPIDNVTIHILDTAGKLVPVGVPGELHIGGVQVARGYFKRPELTLEKFIADPFLKHSNLYRSGDLARWLPDGNIEYLGRTDDQVKIRGYRIELGEIESVLTQSDLVNEAVVLVSPDDHGNKRLVGYIVSTDIFNRSLLEEYLKTRLPVYMVPALWVSLSVFPLTTSGKINRKALPQFTPDAEVDITTYVAPRNETEAALAGVWQELLSMTNIGIHDNFFRLGGDSIITIQLVSRAKWLGYNLKPKDVFMHQTIAELAIVATSRKNTAATVKGEQGQLEGKAELMPIQQWFFEEKEATAQAINHFNQSVLLNLDKGIDQDILTTIVQQLQEHHDVLRFSYQKNETEWVQTYTDRQTQLVQEDLKAIEESALESAITENCQRHQLSLNITTRPQLKMVWIETPEFAKHNRLLIVIHHLSVDGVSWRVLLEDMERLLEGALKKESVSLGEKSGSYRQWYNHLEQYGKTSGLRSQLPYWKEIEKSAKHLPTDKIPERLVTNKDVGSFSIQLDQVFTQQLLQEVSQAYNTGINDLLLAALALTINGWSGEKQLVVGMEGHGREELGTDIDISRTVGWFTNLYPVLLTTDESNQHGNLIKSIKEQLRQIPDKGLGYGVLKYINREPLLQGDSPWNIIFNYLGQFDNMTSEEGLFGYAEESAGQEISSNYPMRDLLSINGMIESGLLSLTWSYSALHYESSTVESLAAAYLVHLKELITHCVTQDIGGQSFTPSDYGLSGEVSYQQMDKFLNSDQDDLEDIISF